MDINVNFDIQVASGENGLKSDSKNSSQDGRNQLNWPTCIEAIFPYITIIILAFLVFFRFGGCCQCKCAEIKQKISNSENMPNTNVSSEMKQGVEK